MSYENLPDSTLDVVTSAGAVMSEFKQMVKVEMPNVSTVFDPLLSYDSAVAKFLKENKNYEGSPLPLFAYNRTITNYGDVGLQKRSKRATGCIALENQDGIAKYSVMQGEFIINFLYITQSMEEVERFEVAYYGEGISKTTEIIVSMPKLGDFSYFLDYNELDDIVIEKEGSYYKSVIGTIKVRGMYFTFKGQSALIKEITSRIISSNNIPLLEENEVLGNILIDETDN